MTHNENASKNGDHYIHESTDFDRTHMIQLSKSTFAIGKRKTIRRGHLQITIQECVQC